MNGIDCAFSCIRTRSTTLIYETRTSWRSAPGAVAAPPTSAAICSPPPFPSLFSSPSFLFPLLPPLCRVLRPGGRFFFADLRSMDGVAALQKQFSSSGLTVDKQTDITSNVLTALRLDSARKLRLIDALIPRVAHLPFRAFAGIAGTRNYHHFESGKLRYLSIQSTKTRGQKPDEAPPWTAEVGGRVGRLTRVCLG